MAEKITRTKVLDASGDMLKWQVYAITTTPNDGMGPVMENLHDHLEFQNKLENDGIMVAAGPLWADDEETWNGEGIVVIRANSLAHAREIADSDPMHARGVRSYTVRPWLINEGSITVKIGFGSGLRQVS